MIAAVVAILTGGRPACAEPQPDRFDVRPVPGRVVRGWDPPASPFGPGHVGILLAGSGRPVRAGLGGVVTFAGRVAGTWYVTVRHRSGLVVRYGRLDRVGVRGGDTVAAGEVIAGGVEHLVGDAALLHLSVSLNGRYLDPTRFLPLPRIHLTA
ncbi:MAG: M23 family metallopeptidase [Acidimicrobiia bacterium]|nr:M23 family metallopeptidase [Acidimicrobiia bacterium]